MKFLWSWTSIHSVTSLFSFGITSNATVITGLLLIYYRIFNPSSLLINTVGILTKWPFPSSFIIIFPGYSTTLSMIIASFPPSFCTFIDFWVNVQSPLSTSNMFFREIGISSKTQSSKNYGIPIYPDTTFP
jgi:hypothetical protein